MNEVEQIVEEILIENDLDWDHPVVDYLFEGVEDTLNELSKGTLRSYATGAHYDSKHHYIRSRLAQARGSKWRDLKKTTRYKSIADYEIGDADREQANSQRKSARRERGRDKALHKIRMKS